MVTQFVIASIYLLCFFTNLIHMSAVIHSDTLLADNIFSTGQIFVDQSMDTGKKYEMSSLLRSTWQRRVRFVKQRTLYHLYAFQSVLSNTGLTTIVQSGSTKTGVRHLRMRTVRDPAPVSKPCLYLAIDLESDIKDWQPHEHTASSRHQQDNSVQISEGLSPTPAVSVRQELRAIISTEICYL